MRTVVRTMAMNMTLVTMTVTTNMAQGGDDGHCDGHGDKKEQNADVDNGGAGGGYEHCSIVGAHDVDDGGRC